MSAYDYTPTTEQVRDFYGANEEFDRWLADHERKIREEALRAAAEKWKPWTPGGCPTCEADRMLRATKGLVCQTCGHDYGADS